MDNNPVQNARTVNPKVFRSYNIFVNLRYYDLKGINNLTIDDNCQTIIVSEYREVNNYLQRLKGNYLEIARR